jgi:hypothetical protein
MERRKFISIATVLATGVTSCASVEPVKNEKMQLVHHVFFWLKNPASIPDRDKLIEGVRTLKEINTIRQLHIGIPASTEKRDVVDNSWHVSEIMFFDDEAGQQVYQDHPIHQAFIKNYSHLWDKVLVYDAAEV